MNSVNKELLIQIENRLTRLQRDPQIIALRDRAPNWVCERLLQRLTERLLKQLNITKEQWEQFLLGQGEDHALVEPLLLETAALSRDRKKEYSLLRSDSEDVAAEWLVEQLLNKEKIAFRKEAGISPATWKRFLESSAYTKENTAAKIAAGLSLNAPEEALFRSLIFHETFEDVSELKDPIKDLLKKKGLTITEFLIQSYISPNAWVPFQGDKAAHPTTQGTLLKMAVGFSMPPNDAKQFLNLVNSDFVMRRDLVVLACMLGDLYDAYQLYEILEIYSVDSIGEKLYQNLYPMLGQ